MVFSISVLQGQMDGCLSHWRVPTLCSRVCTQMETTACNLPQQWFSPNVAHTEVSMPWWYVTLSLIALGVIYFTLYFNSCLSVFTHSGSCIFYPTENCWTPSGFPLCYQSSVCTSVVLPSLRNKTKKQLYFFGEFLLANYHLPCDHKAKLSQVFQTACSTNTHLLNIFGLLSFLIWLKYHWSMLSRFFWHMSD